MKKKKLRKILSVSGVITNSSTQTFEISVTDKFLEIVNKHNLSDEILIIRDKGDVLNILSIPDDSPDEWKKGDLKELLSSEFDLPEFLSDWGGDLKGQAWRKLNESGRSDVEIFEFLEPLWKGIYGKAFYSYEDDCGTPSTAKILYNEGYNSRRE